MMESERLIFRKYTSNDFDLLYGMTSNPKVMKYIRHGGPWTKTETLQSLEKYLNWNKEDKGLFLVFNKIDNQLIGTSGLIPQRIEDTDELEVGYWVTEQYWGNGYGYEQAKAWKEYGMNYLKQRRLISLIQHGNVGSMKIAEKNGMSHEKDVNMLGKNVAVYSLEANG